MSEVRRLLVGYDGSPGGDDALELARLLATIEGVSVLVVSVLPYGPLPVTYALLAEEQEAEAAPLLDKAREKLAGLEVETRAYGGGSPAGVINDLAEQEEVDLIVVGSPHRGPIGRALIGSVAEGLLHGAPCAVSAAPRGYGSAEHKPFGTIAVAYDGTPEAKLALAHGRRLAESTGGNLRILTVISPPVALPGVVGYTPTMPPDAEQINARAVSEASSGVDAEGQVLSGPAATTLAEASEGGVDLLIAGSRHYGPVTRVLLGSVSSLLIHKAPCPVLVVPRP
ncbi:MAG: universal stress protein [Solirubrobacterales bacterium]